MKKQNVLFIFLALTLVLSLFLGVDPVKASTYPTFTIAEVKKGVSVTILTKDMPANMTFKAFMGEFDTQGIDGIEVATFGSGEGGSFAVTFNIPEALKTRAQISIRIEGTDNPHYAYNWFWNDEDSGTWPEPEEPEPPKPDCGCPAVPTVSIQTVEAGKTVTIRTSNFPKNVEFTILMGKMWTRGIGGVEVAKLNSGEGGTFDATFTIPASLVDEERIAIRLDGVGGYYAYNWFWNNAAAVPPSEPPADEYSGYPYFFITSVVRDTNVSIKAHNLPKDTDFKVLMGKMWTSGINGIEVASFNSGEGGELEVTYTIPVALAGQERIALRLQGDYYFAYNWFWNNTTAK